MKTFILIALAAAVVGFPTLYQPCTLPTMGFGAHLDPMMGFGDDYTFSFTDMDGNEATSYTPGTTYMLTVSGSSPFRMTTIVDSGMFEDSDATGAPVCDGLRVNNNDVTDMQTVTWMADDAANATFSVNLAGGCINAYVQDSFMVEAGM
eukprot:TRINITY_DN354_c0_g1_i2.p2 TRINITY_DN354_c0_g1~~TRINITY_DN354_c0_g1_i2.p2  ORF type:complete len:149 (-),score=27.37 TRINITY_DN354_c0_g1_i2:98-544(-)